MRKHRLWVIRKQGDQYRHISILIYRDEITGDYVVSATGFGRMFMTCVEKVIPGLISIVHMHGKFPRRFPCGILATSEKVFSGRKSFSCCHSSD